MKYCSACASPVVVEIPEGDNMPRHVCRRCDTVHYHNPNIVAGCIVEHEGRILLCRRAIEPRGGLWTVPAGFMENGESVADAALRETREEACADAEIDDLYALFNIVHINQVYLIFRGRLRNPGFAAGPESLEVRLFEEAEIPWDRLAFRVVEESLSRYLKERRAGIFTLQMGDIAPRR